MFSIFEKLKVVPTLFQRAGKVFSQNFEAHPSEEMSDTEPRRQRRRLIKYLYVFLFSAVMAGLLTLNDPRSGTVSVLHLGDIAEQDIATPIAAELEPKELTKIRQAELAKRVAPVYDYEESLLEDWQQKWKDAFRKVRLEFYSSRSSKTPLTLDALPQRVFELTGQNLPLKDILFLHQNRFAQPIEQIFSRLAEQLYGKFIASSNLFPIYYNTGIVIRLINQSLRETFIRDVSRIWSIEQAKEAIHQYANSQKDRDSKDSQRIAQMLGHLIIPNLKFNEELTQKRIATTLSRLKQNTLSVKRGEVLVHKGERVTEAQAELLQSIQQLTSSSAMLRRFGLYLLVLFVSFSVLFRLNISNHGFWTLALKDALLFWGIAIFTFACMKFALPYTRALFLPINGGYGVEYLMPISSGAIIIHLMMGKEAAYIFALLLSITMGYLLDQSFYFTIWGFTVMASAIQSIRSCKQRTDLYKSGAWSGMVGALLVFAFFLIQTQGFRKADWTTLWLSVGFALFSGLLSAGLTSSLIPILEALSGYTTSLKLLELSNFNHPLLHALMMKAPGTYHHSVIVGSLAEIAADRVHANALLARVSAYYHDIGKMNKPLYFIENQSPSTNPHDELTPTMSAKILFSHVKDGAKMGRDHNLGSKITSIIEQHHGTTLVSYFYNKAKRTENPEMDPVNEGDFRYPGPRPQTREAAIVMLADACEAATRSINDPTAAKIQSMVRNIINRRFLEEQFNECDLTLTDLQVIEQCFTRTLVSLYHHRIEYPGQGKESQRGDSQPVSKIKTV